MRLRVDPPSWRDEFQPVSTKAVNNRAQGFHESQGMECQFQFTPEFQDECPDGRMGADES
jgi:hypothetical protein